MMIVLRRFILTTFVFLLSMTSFTCQAQQAGALDTIPDFKRCFEILSKNRDIYNAYNDSIFLIKDHDQWVSFFRRRALKNHQLFATNKEAIRTITDYFKRDLSEIPVKAFSQLFVSFRQDFQHERKGDPFLALEICRILDLYNQNVPDSLSFAAMSNLWMAYAYSQMWNLGKDSLALSNAYKYEMTMVGDSLSKFPYYEGYKLYALANLSQVNWLTQGLQTLDEYRDVHRQLKAYLQNERLDSLFNPQTLKWAKNIAKMEDENLLRNVYLTDTTVLDKQVADSLMRNIVKRNLANKNLSEISYIRTLVLQVKLHQLTSKEAREMALRRYKLTRKKILNKRLDYQELATFIRPFYTFFYLNDMAEIPYAKKRKTVLGMCKDIELAYQSRMDNQMNTSYVRNLNLLTTYDRITKYLKPKERVYFLNTLNVATQVTTYAHSMHVAMIAETLMKGILKYQPELLVHSLGDYQISEVRRHKKRYIDFIHNAAMYHDLGKNSIISVVNNDYRPLTDDEFAIIKRHPEYGLQYLELSPDLAKYHDTTLGHHRWYNGKGGYPTWFDNTQSPVRIMIDIVTLSDCMQAATERVGRNYKGEKNFETVMGEFRRDAGTRYNPDLVNFIDEHEDVATQLANLINEGWVDIYYDIYSKFIQ